MPELHKSGEFNSIKISKGVYAALVTCTDIVDLSNYPGRPGEINKRNDGTPYELAIEVKYQREDGQEWSTRFYGNFEKDKVTGKIRGWQPFANGVQDFFETMIGDLTEVGNLLNEDYSISQALIERVKGVKFYRISYVSGFSKKDSSKAAYKDFNRIFLEGTSIETMQEAWARVALRMKTYLPDVVDELAKNKETEDTSFNYGANIEESTGDEEAFEL